MSKANNNSNIEYIYLLSDPRTDIVYYVGRTENPRRRLASHIHDAKFGVGFSARKAWVLSLLNDGVQPIMTVVAQVTPAVAGDIELNWIEVLHRNCCPLTNQEVRFL